MPDKLYQKMHSFVSERFDFTRVLDMLKDESSSHLLEISGKSGSGKSYLIQPMINSLKDVYPRIEYFTPHPLCFNHFPELVYLLTGMREEILDALREEHFQKYHTGKKYDFFYFFTERLLQKDLLKPLVLIIDDCDVLDKYSRDFLQYLVQYSSDSGIQIVLFTQSHLFPFSKVEHLPSLSAEDLQKLLGIIFPSAELSYISEGEILHKISSGNLMILEKIFTEMRLKHPKGGFDLSPYLEKTYDPNEIYYQTLNELSPSQLELLMSMFILDGLDCDAVAEALGKPKSEKSDRKVLLEFGLLGMMGDRCVVQKKSAFALWMKENNAKLEQALLSRLQKYLNDSSLLPQVQVRLCFLTKKADSKKLSGMIDLLESLSDSESLLIINEFLQSIAKNPQEMLESTMKIGIHHSELGQKDKAVDYFRQCLHICTENNIPAEEVVYNLANTLFAVNSSNFALEIIKKYSPSTIDDFWKSRILLLKADILAESEAFNDAFDTLDAVLHSKGKIGRAHV